MRVVMSGIGSIGDLLPYVAVGRELRRRGHEVALVANPRFKKLADTEGFDFAPVGTLDDFERFTADADLWDPTRTSLEQARAAHYYPHLQAFYRGVLDSCAPRRTVVLTGEAAGMAAAEKLGLPLVYLACAPALSSLTQSRYDPTHPERVLPEWAQWFAMSGRRLSLLYRMYDLRHRRNSFANQPPALPAAHPIAHLRDAVGLPHVDYFDPHPRLALCMWAEWFAAPQRDWPREAVVTGFPFYPTPKPSPRKARIEPDAPIVVTTGSLAGSQFTFYETAVEACKAIDRPVVLVSPHRNHIPADLPPRMKWVAHAPFADLFATASLVVHHGGIGTASYAMAAGVPQIVMPMRWDQFDNGNRTQRLGIGRMLSPKATSAPTLTRTMTQLLQSSRVRARCLHWQSQIDVEGGVRNAVDAIETRT